MTYRDRVLVEATFDTKLKTYMVLQGVVGFTATIVGIVALPFWLVLGTRWGRRYFEHLSCTLTDRARVVRKGVWFRSESTVPLDRIQDVAIRHGPILDRLGLATIRVETAGMGSGQGSGINLTGVVDTAGFRDRVLEARDRAAGFADEEEGAAALGGVGRAALTEDTAREGDATRGAPSRTPAASGTLGGSEEATAVLVEIRDSLARIEELLGRGEA